MTNSPTDRESPENHDLSPDDLQLTPKRGVHRRERVPDRIDGSMPGLVLTPQKSSHSHHSHAGHHHSHSGHHHHHHHHRHKKKPGILRRVLLIAGLSLLGILVVAAGTFAALTVRGRAALKTAPDVTISAPLSAIEDPEIVITDDGRTVVYKGATYVFNENRTNILCIGMDKNDMGLDNNTVGTGGQADTLVVLSVDTATGEVDALAISRDTMVDVDLYTADGSFYGVERTQICLSYAYGDGRETSCDNVVRSASRLLYGIPINTYYCINLDTIPVLNDAIGGVTLPLLKDFRRTGGYWNNEGDIVTLYGEEADRYVRDRNTSKLDSNNDRMERQKQYINAFFEQTLEATKQDLQVPLNLYNIVKEDSISTLSPSKITYLATTLVQHDSSLTFHQVPGNVVKSEADGLAEYEVDEAALYEQVLSIFYTRV